MFSKKYEHRRKKAVSYQTLLLNTPAKDDQETAKATPRAQLRRYVDEVLTMTLPSNTFEFWQERRRESPVLFTLSTNTLCVPASSAPLERNFSASGLTMRPQGTRLSSEMLEIFVYLKSNFNFLENKKIDSTWCYGFILKRLNDCRSRLLLVSVSNQRSR